ncbi:MAG: methylenetetrahydrofolate reductase C-terminal domain-containing protein [Oscillospiraceae bacterium]|nr:methylenetetrahydrofolate reductase C-terminal domain-containing protein [Oscillospiraceae bacterium]
MIVAELKDVHEISELLEEFNSVVIAACGTCVTVCMAGGEKEALRLAGMLEVEAAEKGRELSCSVITPTRQCDMEFLDENEEALDAAECILSLGCGAGVQFLAEKFPEKVVLPGLNTKFIGVNRDLGYWTEMCQGCGNCLLAKTGGVCPVTRCSKINFNGPCGGSVSGKCEIDPETDCAWQLIYDRLKRLGRVDKLLEISEIRDWRTARDGGPRSVRRDDVIV